MQLFNIVYLSVLLQAPAAASEAGSGESGPVGITVQYFKNADCSGKPAAQATANPASGDPPYAEDVCVKPATVRSFAGACPSLETTTMMYYADGETQRAGLNYQVMDEECSVSYGWSAMYDVPWTVPTCQSCMTVFGGDCDGGIEAVKFSCGDVTCFPSHATVTLESGNAVKMSALQAGDKILAARADGTFFHDTVSRFSLAQLDARAPFVSLQTDGTLGPKQLSLTASHHLPVGPSKTLKQASNVKLGETVWVMDKLASTLVAQAVTAIDVTVSDGLHNPLLVHGGMPIVDGVATSFNSKTIVTIDSYAVPVIEALCAATGTCTPVRKAIASVECTAKHLFNSKPTCKSFHYIDGATAGGAPLFLEAAALATVAILVWSARK